MSWPRRRSRSGWRETSASSSPTRSACRPSASVGLDAVLQADELQLLEARGLGARERLGELGERGAAPQRERLAQPAGGGRGVALRERRPARVAQGGEPDEVERVRVDLQRVAGRPRLEQVRGQRLAQLRDVDVHHLDRRAGDLVPPQVIDELVDGDDPVRPRAGAGRAPRAAGARRARRARRRRAPRADRGSGTPCSHRKLPAPRRIYRASTGHWSACRMVGACPPPHHAVRRPRP